MIQRSAAVRIQISRAAPGARWRILRVSHENQANVLWCWVAVFRMVLEKQPGELSRSGFPSASIDDLTQCNIASVVRNARCCEDQSPSRCLRGLTIRRVADAWTKFNVPRPKFVPRKLSFADVRRQLEKRRPIQVGAGFGIAGRHVGHTVLIYGFHQGEAPADQRVYLHDPLATGGTAAIPFSDLEAGDDSRPPWRWTWIDLPRVPEA